jgi:hypothetical protein
MILNDITKVHEGLYKVSSLACPTCGEILTVELPGSLLYAYNTGAYIYEVFPDMSPDDRERFITGWCGPCWYDIFDEDQEEYDE